MMRMLRPFAALALLGACAVMPGGGVERLVILQGAVTVEGPEGYCVDTGLSRPGRGFAALANCAIISDIALAPGIDGFITVQVGEAGTAGVTGAETTLAALLQSPDGAALLAGDNDPATIVMDTVESSAGLVIVHFTDTGAPLSPGLEQLEWRAFLDLGDRLTTIGVRGFARDPLSRADGLRLLNRAVFSLRAANSAESAPATGG